MISVMQYLVLDVLHYGIFQATSRNNSWNFFAITDIQNISAFTWHTKIAAHTLYGQHITILANFS